MRCGAFVDPSRVKQYTEADFILPETPPFHWLLPKPKDDTSSLKSGTDEDRQSINSPTEAPSSADENSSTNANNILNNNSKGGSFESAGPMNFRLSQSPKSGEPNVAAAAGGPVAAGASAAPAAGSNSGSPPASLTGEFRRSSRWSIRQTGPEDERLLKELHFPFAASNSPIGDLAKFYRECFNAPPLQEFNQLSNVISNVDDEEAANADDGGRILTGADELVEDDVDDLTRQLEQFETSLPEFETLVTSLCQSVDTNSNS